MADIMLNPFVGDAYSVGELTKAINIMPNNYARIQRAGVFIEKGVTQRAVFVEEQGGVLNLLQTKPVGSPGTMDRRGKRTLRTFAIPHIPHDGELIPEEYNGIRAFGTGNQLDGPATKLAEKLARMRSKHDITREHLMMGALKGIILDADGSTLYNLYTEFGLTQVVVDFALNNAATNVDQKCRTVIREIEKQLKGEVMTSVKSYVSPEFFDAFIAHAKVADKYVNWVAAEQLRSGQAVGKESTGFVRQFPFGGILFEEYQGEATDADGNVRRFIASKEGHSFPVGTMESFELLYAPADFLETAGTIGLPIYAKQEPRKFNRGIDIHTQSNPLPICYRPGVLVKVTTP